MGNNEKKPANTATRTAELKTLHRQYKRGKVTREAFMDALVEAHMNHEVTDAFYRRYSDDVTADMYLDEDIVP